MQSPLRAVNPEDVDPRIAAQLEPGEMVLWQNHPAAGSFFGPLQILGALALVMLGIVIATGAVGPDLPPELRYAPAAVTVGVGLLLLITRWRSRAVLWSYAITDRRLLSVLRNKVIRSVTPEQLDRCRLRVKGDTVYWLRPLVRSRHASGANKGSDGPLIGFHGQADAQATKLLIESWRQGMSERVAVGAAAFVKTMNSAVSAVDEAATGAFPAGVLRVSHAPTGLNLDVLPDWKVTVKTRSDGPLRLFGVTLLPRIIRDGPERPYGDGGGWNVLSVRGAPEAGLDLTIYDKPLELTLDAVLNDPFTRLTGTEILHSRPDVRIGLFSGFSVIRKMPSAMQIKSVPSLSAAAMLQQVWLGHDGTSLEVTGYALESQTDVQDAIDAMIASIRLPA